MTNEDEFFDDSEGDVAPAQYQPAPQQHQPHHAPEHQPHHALDDDLDAPEVDDDKTMDGRGRLEDRAPEVDPTVIPESWDGYAVDAEKHGLTQQDQGLLESFLQHGAAPASMSQGQLDQALSWYKSIHEENTQRLVAVDVEDKGRAVESLRKEYGAGYQSQIQELKAILTDSLPKETIRVLNQARDPATGKRIINDPAFLKMILNNAGHGSGQSSGGRRGTAAPSASERLEQLQSVLQSDPSKYFAKPPGGAGKSMADQALDIQRGLDATLQSSRSGKSAREVQIEKLLETDPRRYWAEGWDRELLAIKQRRGR